MRLHVIVARHGLLAYKDLLVGSLPVKITKSIAMNTEFANNDYAKPLKVQSSAKGQLMT